MLYGCYTELGNSRCSLTSVSFSIIYICYILYGCYAELGNSRCSLTSVLYCGTKVSISKKWTFLLSNTNIELALFTFSIVCLSKLKTESMITPTSLPQLLTEVFFSVCTVCQHLVLVYRYAHLPLSGWNSKRHISFYCDNLSRNQAEVVLCLLFFIFDDVEDLFIICKHIHIAFKHVWQNVNKYYSQSFVILVWHSVNVFRIWSAFL